MSRIDSSSSSSSSSSSFIIVVAVVIIMFACIVQCVVRRWVVEHSGAMKGVNLCGTVLRTR